MAEFENEDLKQGEAPLELTPLSILYCPHCTMPPEFCEYGPCYEERCLPWIQDHLVELEENDIHLLSNETKKLSVDQSDTSVAAADQEDNEDEEGDEKKKKKRSAPKLKKVIELETKVIITKVQRQKRKYVTVVAGLETVPNLKIKDASKAFGKKFSSGASINESASGVKEVVIQGDVMFDLPPLLVSQFNVPPTCIFYLDGTTLTPYR